MACNLAVLICGDDDAPAGAIELWHNEPGEGAIGKVLLTGVPAVTEHAACEPAGMGASALRAGLTGLLAIPILRDGRLTAAVALYF